MWGKVQGGLYTLLNSLRFFFGSIKFQGWRQIIFQRSRLLVGQWSRGTRIDDAFPENQIVFTHRFSLASLIHVSTLSVTSIRNECQYSFSTDLQHATAFFTLKRSIIMQRTSSSLEYLHRVRIGTGFQRRAGVTKQGTQRPCGTFSEGIETVATLIV